jgi:cell wall-associated NlpC family hydrolase
MRKQTTNAEKTPARRNGAQAATSPKPTMTPAPALRYAAVAVPLTNVHREPNPASELVNQALLGTPATCLAQDSSGAWTQVRLPDYEGWVANAALAPEPQPALAAAPDQYVRVTATTATVQAANPDGTREDLPVFAGTLLQRRASVDAERVAVQLPDGRPATVAAQAVAPLLEHTGARGDVAAVLATAHTFLDTPYLWGGMSVQGIDCSGLVQTAYRVQGYALPRDANVQFTDLPNAVERSAWEPGDLLFFGNGPHDITHVGLFLGQNKVIHATGSSQPPGVVIQSVNPADPDYSPRLDRTYQGARRIIMPE